MPIPPSTAQQNVAIPLSGADRDRGMRKLVAEHDWSSTSLGSIEGWPVGLKAVVNLMLDSVEPMVIWWGEESLQIYNDAYAPRVDHDQPGIALGQPAVDSWRHGWSSVSPLVKRVLAGEPSTVYTDFLYSISRDGWVEDTYWTYSFTPVRDDAGIAQGVLLISDETTDRTLSMRRQRTLDLLRQELANATTTEALAVALQLVVAANPDDLHGAQLTALHDGAGLPAGILPVRVTAADVGIDVDLAIVFERSPKVAFNAAYRLFFDQLTLLLATARRRLDNEARRLIVEAERDRLLLDAPVGAAVMIGEALVYHLVNSIYAMVSGRPAEAMVGKQFVDVYPELKGSPVHEKFKEVYQRGEPYISAQPTLVQIHRHGGKLDDRYFTYNLSPLRALDGTVYGLMVIAVDVTDQVDARAEVEKLNVELQAAARAKDEFLALLGHELRNPLAPIVTALDLMRMRDRSTEREQVVIRRQVTHLTRLVDDLLDVSRITRGKVELRRELVDVREVLAGAVEMVMPLITQRQQHLATEIVSVPWYGDPARLAQIVSNLLTNASRYSPSGAHISLRALADGNQLEIDVTDNGSGLSAELLPRIFEPFVQGERKLHGAVGGLGIGLALVKNLTELHGGQVTVQSEGQGKGSMFSVRLPLTASPVTPSYAAPAPVSTPMQPLRVLLVDDNVDAADTLAEVLRSHGHTVAVAYTPAAALEMFAHQYLDLAILDIGLPEISGHELAGLMRGTGRNPAVRYVALSGFGQDADKERSAAAGFAAHFVKPLVPEALHALLAA